MRRTVILGFLAAAAVLLVSPSSAFAACQITPDQFPNGNLGTEYTVFPTSTGCATNKKPVKFNLVAGKLPNGLKLTPSFGVASAVINGRPTTSGTFQFTLRVTDQTGARDTEAFSITIDGPRPVVITNQSDALSPGTVGEFYCCGNLFADGGTPPYDWTLGSGALPPGLSLQRSPGRITGTPTTAGTFSFWVRATDQRGAFAERTFSITIS